MSHPYEPIRLQIKADLRARKIRQKHLAVKVGITEKHLSQLLTGKICGPLAMWVRIADAADMRLVLTLVPKESTAKEEAA